MGEGRRFLVTPFGPFDEERTAVDGIECDRFPEFVKCDRCMGYIQSNGIPVNAREAHV